MSQTVSPQRIDPWTFEDLEHLPEGNRYEIVDGQLVMSPPPGVNHQYVAGTLRALLQEQLGDAFVVLEAVAIDLHPTYRIPDVVVIDTAGFEPTATRLDPRHVRLVVEIVSPSSVTTDRITKPAEYAAAGIGAFWRVEMPATLIAHVLDEGAYREISTWSAGETAAVAQPFNLAIDLSRLLPPSPTSRLSH